MNSIDLKKEVTQAVGLEWNAFAFRHPHLAAALDQELLIEQAVACLADDPAFASAMEQAALLGTLGQTAGDTVQKFVKDFFQRVLQ